MATRIALSVLTATNAVKEKLSPLVRLGTTLIVQVQQQLVTVYHVKTVSSALQESKFSVQQASTRQAKLTTARLVLLATTVPMPALELLCPAPVDIFQTSRLLLALSVPPTTTRLVARRAAHPYHLVFISLKLALNTLVLPNVARLPTVTGVIIHAPRVQTDSCVLKRASSTGGSRAALVDHTASQVFSTCAR